MRARLNEPVAPNFSSDTLRATAVTPVVSAAAFTAAAMSAAVPDAATLMVLVCRPAMVTVPEAAPAEPALEPVVATVAVDSFSLTP